MKARLFLALTTAIAGLSLSARQSHATSGRVFTIHSGKTYYLGTWHLVRNSRSLVDYSFVFNSRQGYVYRLFPSRKSVGGHVQMSYVGYSRGRAFSAGQAFLRTNARGGPYSGSIRRTHSRNRAGKWVRTNGRWDKIYFTIDRR